MRLARFSASVGQLKAMLPTHAYLRLLHQGAMTGFLPRFSTDGKPTGQFDNLSPTDRVAIARYLVDKVVPDAPKEVALTTSPADGELSTTAMSRLSSDELRRLATMAPGEETPQPAEAPLTEAPEVMHAV